MRLRSELAADREKLEQERQQWQTQSRASDVAKLRDVYFDKGAPAVVDVIKQWMPGLEGDDLKREVADLIQDLAHQYLEAPLDEPTKDRITNKRVRVGLKTWKQDQERAEEERQKQQAASQEEANKLRVKSILHQEVMKSDNASQYPWLASEDNAGDLVFETIEQEFKQSSTQLTWQQLHNALTTSSKNERVRSTTNARPCYRPSRLRHHSAKSSAPRETNRSSRSQAPQLNRSESQSNRCQRPARLEEVDENNTARIR
jgi:hypothetical protein